MDINAQFTRMGATGTVLLVAGAAAVATLAGSRSTWHSAAALAIAFAVVYLSLDRDTWLPFLGPTVVPGSAISKNFAPTGSTSQITISTPAKATHVMYWAASPGQSVVASPRIAYGQYRNTGVAEALDGKATLAFQCPARYRVRGVTLKKHVHYRFVFADGTLSRVLTAPALC